jgi:amino-acid N-acetyltransferase
VIDPVTDPPTAATTVTVRPARTTDVSAIRRLVDAYAADGVLLDKPMVTLYEDMQEFLVAELTTAAAEAQVVGCGALHVMWEDLAEIRTLAVDPACTGHGIGHVLLQKLIHHARQLGVQRLFCLTFEVTFFARHGFEVFDEVDLDPAVRGELMRSYDEGVAEFLGLEHVKPNILGNTRMRLDLTAGGG